MTPKTEVDCEKDNQVCNLVEALLSDIHKHLRDGKRTRGKQHESNWPLVLIHQTDLTCEELKREINLLRQDIESESRNLLQELNKKDKLRNVHTSHCDVITAYIQALSNKTKEEAKMRFALTPGETGFSQWLDAMKMVAQLPGGMPPEFRTKLWLQLSEKHFQDKNIDWPRVERAVFSEWSNPDDEELGVQIVKDLHRTGCSLFCGEEGEQNQALLKRVLLAYARWNKSVGYCQGFNMLAALILQVMDRDEKNAVKVMIYLIDSVLPESYFANNLRGLSVDMAVFRDLMKTRLPKLSRHLDALQQDTSSGNNYEPPLTNVFTMQWFLTLFSNCLPQPTVLRVWDLVFLYGNEVLLRTALAIWGILQDRVMSVESADEFYSIMGVVTREMLEFGLMDANNLVKTIVMVDPFHLELQELRDKYLYNISPWSQSVQTAAKRGFRLFHSDNEDQDDTEDEATVKALATAYGVFRRRESTSRDVTPAGPTLDIGVLKQQYAKLLQRQRQAHVIISAACTGNVAGSSVSVNQLLAGKSALIGKGRRIGPPEGSIPPPTQLRTGKKAKVPISGETLNWKDVSTSDEKSYGLIHGSQIVNRSSQSESRQRTNHDRKDVSPSHVTEIAVDESFKKKELKKRSSSSSSSSTELCDDEFHRYSDFDSEDTSDGSVHHLEDAISSNLPTLGKVDEQFSESIREVESLTKNIDRDDRNAEQFALARQCAFNLVEDIEERLQMCERLKVVKVEISRSSCSYEGRSQNYSSNRKQQNIDNLENLADCLIPHYENIPSTTKACENVLSFRNDIADISKKINAKEDEKYTKTEDKAPTGADEANRNQIAVSENSASIPVLAERETLATQIMKDTSPAPLDSKEVGSNFPGNVHETEIKQVDDCIFNRFSNEKSISEHYENENEDHQICAESTCSQISESLNEGIEKIKTRAGLKSVDLEMESEKSKDTTLIMIELAHNFHGNESKQTGIKANDLDLLIQLDSDKSDAENCIVIPDWDRRINSVEIRELENESSFDGDNSGKKKCAGFKGNDEENISKAIAQRKIGLADTIPVPQSRHSDKNIDITLIHSTEKSNAEDKKHTGDWNIQALSDTSSKTIRKLGNEDFFEENRTGPDLKGKYLPLDEISKAWAIKKSDMENSIHATDIKQVGLSGQDSGIETRFSTEKSEADKYKEDWKHQVSLESSSLGINKLENQVSFEGSNECRENITRADLKRNSLSHTDVLTLKDLTLIKSGLADNIHVTESNPTRITHTYSDIITSFSTEELKLKNHNLKSFEEISPQEKTTNEAGFETSSEDHMTVTDLKVSSLGNDEAAFLKTDSADVIYLTDSKGTGPRGNDFTTQLKASNSSVELCDYEGERDCKLIIEPTSKPINKIDEVSKEKFNKCKENITATGLKGKSVGFYTSQGEKSTDITLIKSNSPVASFQTDNNIRIRETKEVLSPVGGISHKREYEPKQETRDEYKCEVFHAELPKLSEPSTKIGRPYTTDKSQYGEEGINHVRIKLIAQEKIPREISKQSTEEITILSDGKKFQNTENYELIGKPSFGQDNRKCTEKFGKEKENRHLEELPIESADFCCIGGDHSLEITPLCSSPKSDSMRKDSPTCSKLSAFNSNGHSNTSQINHQHTQSPIALTEKESTSIHAFKYEYPVVTVNEQSTNFSQSQKASHLSPLIKKESTKPYQEGSCSDDFLIADNSDAFGDLLIEKTKEMKNTKGNDEQQLMSLKYESGVYKKADIFRKIESSKEEWESKMQRIAELDSTTRAKLSELRAERREGNRLRGRSISPSIVRTTIDPSATKYDKKLKVSTLSFDEISTRTAKLLREFSVTSPENKRPTHLGLRATEDPAAIAEPSPSGDYTAVSRTGRAAYMSKTTLPSSVEYSKEKVKFSPSPTYVKPKNTTFKFKQLLEECYGSNDDDIDFNKPPPKRYQAFSSPTSPDSQFKSKIKYSEFVSPRKYYLLQKRRSFVMEDKDEFLTVTSEGSETNIHMKSELCKKMHVFPKSISASSSETSFRCDLTNDLAVDTSTRYFTPEKNGHKTSPSKLYYGEIQPKLLSKRSSPYGRSVPEGLDEPYRQQRLNQYDFHSRTFSNTSQSPQKYSPSKLHTNDYDNFTQYVRSEGCIKREHGGNSSRRSTSPQMYLNTGSPPRSSELFSDLSYKMTYYPKEDKWRLETRDQDVDVKTTKELRSPQKIESKQADCYLLNFVEDKKYSHSPTSRHYEDIKSPQQVESKYVVEERDFRMYSDVEDISLRSPNSSNSSRQENHKNFNPFPPRSPQKPKDITVKLGLYHTP